MRIFRRKEKIFVAGRGFAVVLVDMQREFVDSLEPKERKRIIPAQKKILKSCAKKDIPLVVIEYSSFGETIKELQEHIKKIATVRTIIKAVNDGFARTDLNATLREFGVREIFFMGVNASVCVLETAKSALEEGYKIVSAESVIADSHWVSDFDKSKRWYLENGTFFDAGETLVLC